MRKTAPDKNQIRDQYTKDYETRKQITRELEERTEACLDTLSSNYTVKARVKSFDSYFKKYVRYLKEHKKDTSANGFYIPMIHDLIGIRVVCPFLNDIDAARQAIEACFLVVEREQKGDTYSFKEFGYEALHLLVEVPPDIGAKYRKANGSDFSGEIAEIQIRTILQDAWAEVEHELVYKAEWTPYDMPMKRKLAAVNASLTLADTIFEEIRLYQKQLKGLLGQRHTAFLAQIEQHADPNFGEKEAAPRIAPPRSFSSDSHSIDDLLLNALYAHNRGLFDDAVKVYSTILNMAPEQKIASVILKHRGMAYFAQSQYREAIADFEESARLDPSAYNAKYYCGIVRSCLKEWQEAADSFTASLAIYPYQLFCFFRRAQVYYHMEDYPMSLADCESALSMDKEFEQGKRLKKLLLEKLRM